MPFLRLAVVIATLACAGSAVADEPDKARAQELFREGQGAYQSADYAAALQAFQAAYDLVPAPALHFNIAQCHRKLGDHARALESLEQFVALQKNIPAAMLKDAKAQIEEERELLAAAATTDAEPAPGGAGEPGAPPPPSGAASAAAPVAAGDGDAEIWANPFVIGAAVGTAVIALLGGTVMVVALAAPGPTPPTTSLGTVDLR